MPPSTRSQALDSLSVVFWGGFSGTVRMLEEPMARRTDVTYHDITPITRDLALMPARARAQLGAVGKDYPWHKTTGWSKAVQSYAIDNGWVTPDSPTLFYQTLAAPVLPEEFVYSVYTDRVGREGALGHDDFRSRWGPGWLEREEQFLLGARSIFVMGPSTKRILGDGYGVPPERVHVVGAGPGTEIGQIGEVVRKPKRLLFVGTNWGLKGGPDVVAAYEKLVPHHADLELTMVGSDPVGPIPEAVQVLGRVDRKTMPGLFASHDVFVVPTHMEALGYSLLEALMHGLPAIGSSVGNQEWLIADAGTTIEPGDVDGLVDAVENVLDDYPTYKTAAIRRARQLRDEMTWEHVAEALTDAGAYR